MTLDLSNFDDFSKLALDGEDISRFKDYYKHMADLNGAILVQIAGFEFSLEGEDEIANAKDLFDTFAPGEIYVGTEEAQAKLALMGRISSVQSFFGDEGFAVVLRVPYAATLTSKHTKYA